MVKLIQDMPSTNDGEQYKDNKNNNITKYLEHNKDRILNYLIHKAIDTIYSCTV